MLLPARMAVLNYLSTVKNADINEIMEAMKPQYGHEKQFYKGYVSGSYDVLRGPTECALW